MILVCGDAMRDIYYWGEVSRISPEAPVPVLRVLREEERPGAAENVAANVRAMAGYCLSVTSLTSRKIRLVARNQQVARVDFDCEPTETEQTRVNVSFVDALKDTNIVLFSDYGKGTLRDVSRFIGIAKANGCTVLVDPKGHDYMRYAGADLIKPNIHELRDMVGGWSDEAQLAKRVAALMAEASIGAVLLTRAAAGMTLFRGGDAYSVPAAAQEVYDVTGAGDTAIAAFAVALERGHTWEEAVDYANKAAAITCRHFGTYATTKEEVFG